MNSYKHPTRVNGEGGVVVVALSRQRDLGFAQGRRLLLGLDNLHNVTVGGRAIRGAR